MHTYVHVPVIDFRHLVNVQLFWGDIVMFIVAIYLIRSQCRSALLHDNGENEFEQIREKSPKAVLPKKQAENPGFRLTSQRVFPFG